MGGRERQHPGEAASQPAGGRGGEEGREPWRGAEAGAGDRGRKAPRLGVSDQTHGKGWRLGRRQNQAQRPEVGGGGGEGTGANAGSWSSARSSGHRKRKRRWGCEGMKRARGGGRPGGARLSTHVRAGTRTHALAGLKLYAHPPPPSPGLCFSSVGTRCFRPPPPKRPLSGPQPPRPSLLPPTALALPALGGACGSEAPSAALGRGPPESPTLRGERWAWPTTPWPASRWDKFLSATCTSSGAFTWLGRWAGLCSRGGVSSSW